MRRISAADRTGFVKGVTIRIRVRSSRIRAGLYRPQESGPSIAARGGVGPGLSSSADWSASANWLHDRVRAAADFRLGGQRTARG